MTISESEQLDGWVHFWKQIKTQEYRTSFLLSLDPALARKLFKRLKVENAMDLLTAIKG